MSSNRPHQSPGGASSVPSTSSSSGTGGTGNSNGGGGSNAVSGNGNNSGNVVPSRTLAATSEGGLSVPSLAAVPSSRGGFASLSKPSASSGSRKRSLHQTPLYNGLLNSYEDKSNDFVWLVFFCKALSKLVKNMKLNICFYFLLNKLFCLLFQPHLFWNDRRGTHDQVWAQFLVSEEAVGWLQFLRRYNHHTKLIDCMFIVRQKLLKLFFLGGSAIKHPNEDFLFSHLQTRNIDR